MKEAGHRIWLLKSPASGYAVLHSPRSFAERYSTCLGLLGALWFLPKSKINAIRDHFAFCGDRVRLRLLLETVALLRRWELGSIRDGCGHNQETNQTRLSCRPAPPLPAEYRKISLSRSGCNLAKNLVFGLIPFTMATPSATAEVRRGVRRIPHRHAITALLPNASMVASGS